MTVEELPMKRARLLACASAMICLAATISAEAGIIYVNNVTGLDRFDGESIEPRSAVSGPVKSLRRGMQLARFGDVVSIANNPGLPYFDSLSVAGVDHSGDNYHRFIIEGNGATLSGLRAVPGAAWEEHSEGVWRISFTRKHWIDLRDARNVSFPRFTPNDASVASRPPTAESLPAGQWQTWRGAIYLHPDADLHPPKARFLYPAEDFGITLNGVTRVAIRNLIIENFRIDGVRAQNMCREVELTNVTIRGNVRAGVSANRSSTVRLVNCVVGGNGEAPTLEEGLGRIQADDSVVGDELPTVEAPSAEGT